MDAKILRAAVSAAIRVTVSTTMIGCGGVVSTDESGRAGATPVTGSSTSNDETASTKSSGGQGGEPYHRPGGISSTAGTTPSESGTGGSSSVGGSDVGGMASTTGAGQAGEVAGAGAPPERCGSELEGCLAVIDGVMFGETMPSESAKACCQTVLAGLSKLEQDRAECFSDVNLRLMNSPGRHLCCSDPATWQQPACTPWGPPAPPELSLDVLLSWGAAA
jgi:hypothetical protein